jgi:hypothetical protein
MPTCLQFALTNAMPGEDEEFNRWYSDHHMPGVLTVPGLLAGQRFNRIDAPWPSGKHDYLLIWELDDPGYALDQLAAVRNSGKLPKSPTIDMATVQPPTMWRRAIVRTAVRIATDTSSRKSVVLVLANPAEGQDDAFVDSLVRGGLATLADSAGVLSAEFLTLADEQIRGSARKYRYGLLLELADETVGVKSLEKLLPAIPHLHPEQWLAPAFRPLGARLTAAAVRAMQPLHS